MDWITDTIAIGNYLEAQDAELLGQASVRSVLSLDGSLTQQRADELGLERVVTTVLVDGPGNDLRVFRGAIESLTFLAGTKPPVLVQCHAGRSRSVAVVAGYLIVAQEMAPEQAIEQITAKRECSLAPGLEELLYKL
jgi:protein-tyrosine phosphatase